MEHLTRVAGAATTPGTGETTTTTQPPDRPTADDKVLLDRVQSTELAAANLYASALAGTALDDNQRLLVAVMQQSHTEYAQTITGLLGRAATQTPGTAVGAAESAFTGSDGAAIVAAAYELENSLVASNLEAVGAVASSDAAVLLASIVTAEGRHSVALADLMGSTSLDELLGTVAR